MLVFFFMGFVIFRELFVFKFIFFIYKLMSFVKIMFIFGRRFVFDSFRVWELRFWEGWVIIVTVLFRFYSCGRYRCF